EDYPAACRRAADAKHLDPQAIGVSLQTFGLFEKIKQLDALVRVDPSCQSWLIEVHPEVTFERLARERTCPDASPLERKKNPVGREQRLELLRRAFADVGRVLESWRPQKGFSVASDDRLDAYAILWSALRFRARVAETLGGELDPCGIRMQIVV